MVDLILLERVEKLGQMGQVVKVKPGYARNYLLPQKKAMRATKDNLAYFETQRAQLEATNLQRKAEAGEVAAISSRCGRTWPASRSRVWLTTCCSADWRSSGPPSSRNPAASPLRANAVSQAASDPGGYQITLPSPRWRASSA